MKNAMEIMTSNAKSASLSVAANLMSLLYNAQIVSTAISETKNGDSAKFSMATLALRQFRSRCSVTSLLGADVGAAPVTGATIVLNGASVFAGTAGIGGALGVQSL